MTQALNKGYTKKRVNCSTAYYVALSVNKVNGFLVQKWHRRV